jgi:hypothetical protein
MFHAVFHERPVWLPELRASFSFNCPKRIDKGELQEIKERRQAIDLPKEIDEFWERCDGHAGAMARYAAIADTPERERCNVPAETS